ncbi:glycolipid transfer protein domain-containing protein 2 isoform X2 [Triplophysa rosa]|uniref:glycolipid transfer protein domain-containing protein 2 isoform X2 n=1 Tax=Triplophysa rosa TaxID=992332 RepID=UPI0025462A8B|nr:glycolipid transfer protein domain-containing protein 2 isoform X2 [Triplophysa rosa]XP_057183367.1 glycolipid transfer protein domain-containing protein 2 isoform X2 [Triplophysa rosa]XP_057183369.1 glycolipid transfer protein domain-containing protein 2 isoform X2 [Triplophysa rosa]
MEIAHHVHRRDGSLEQEWNTCYKIYNSNKKVLSLNISNSSDEGEAPLLLCPGQRFQVANLLAHLQAAPVSGNDVLLKPYLASWDELINFMEALGPMVGLISQEIESKTSVIRNLAQKAETVSGDTFGYTSVRSMIERELEIGLVDFQKHTDSGCRTLLRLHRALLWLQSFLRELAKGSAEGERLQSPSDLCRETYRLTLAQYHTWWVRRAAELAFIAIPERPYFYQLVCVDTQAEAAVVLERVVREIGEVYERTEVALDEHDMLKLP